MFAFSKTFVRTSRPLLTLGLATWIATAPLLAAERRPADAIPMVAGETWRGPGGMPGDDATLSIRLDSAGLLLIDVDVPVAAPAVRLVLLRPEIAGRGNFQILGQSPTTLALAASPGDYFVRVAADDPRQPLAPWHLRTRFATGSFLSATAGKSGASAQTNPDPRPTSGPGTLIEIDPDPDKSETGTQTEGDPDPSTSGTGTQTNPGPRPTSGPGTLIEIDPDPDKSETGTQTEGDPDLSTSGTGTQTNPGPRPTSGPGTLIEIDPDPNKTETGTQIEIDPDAVKAIAQASGSPSAASRLLRRLCRQGEIDDHGDSFACATPLQSGVPAQGALRNDHGDDSDVFRFEVSALGPVELRAGAAFALAGELYDGHGQRLDTAVAEGRGGLRLVRTLVPGTYFLRLQGWNGAEGTYTVAFGSPRKDR